MIPAALLLTAALAADSAPARSVQVELLSSRPCQALSVSGAALRHDVALRDGRLLLDGRTIDSPWRLPAGQWHIQLPAAERYVDGAIELRAERERIRILAALELEAYVAWTVASETEASTPPDALRAQAVVARSYAVAVEKRHEDVALCDLAHCQLLRGGLPAAHMQAARQAATATRGEVLRLDSGRVANALFHAACGGHTADPAELFGGEGTGAAAVPDDGCAPRSWEVMVARATFDKVVTAKLGRAGRACELEWRIGRGGYVVQVALEGRYTGGEGFARALDAELGHRAIRSSRFAATDTARGVLIAGTGIGHGAGLCQAGAARLAAGGRTYREILAHYFPRATIGRLEQEPLRENHRGASP